MEDLCDFAEVLRTLDVLVLLLPEDDYFWGSYGTFEQNFWGQDEPVLLLIKILILSLFVI